MQACDCDCVITVHSGAQAFAHADIERRVLHVYLVGGRGNAPGAPGGPEGGGPGSLLGPIPMPCMPPPGGGPPISPDIAPMPWLPIMAGFIPGGPIGGRMPWGPPMPIIMPGPIPGGPIGGRIALPGPPMPMVCVSVYACKSVRACVRACTTSACMASIQNTQSL